MPRIGLGYGIDTLPNGGGDPDVARFLTATGINDPTQVSAITTLVSDLKTANAWEDFVFIYPFVGGTAAAHAQNLKSAAFPITWNGTVTHNANGITGNGVDGYGNTQMNPAIDLAGQHNNCHISFYTRSGVVNSGSGVIASLGGNRFAAYPPFVDGTSYFDMTDAVNGRVSGVVTTRLLLGSRVSNVDLRLYRDGGLVATDVNNNVSVMVNGNFTILAINDINTSIGQFGAHNFAFATAGLGLSPAKAVAFNTAVNTFQVALGRNV